ncbi:protein of unknown function [Taphrina deformans PYCC 5710]|uniref:CoA-binding domain-containing protein n=1 Tax=Taphrina deformans (strain PYCC 5710 / ATCC 11124 / CBS 356.35 / IMI 108563 / JCM 9778 / NBRC 8474) TaxID=1097556 RepID=S0BE60_TAPDE|nr:protein of unknown function [Taphrina deformans PYCC 5710]|eukprot:CCG84900.1 protein of unknown function [Taphrina deformans PYCC 5710]
METGTVVKEIEVQPSLSSIKELVGHAIESNGEPQGTTPNEVGLVSHGKKTSTTLTYSDKSLPEALLEQINQSLRFDTTREHRIQLKSSLNSLWRTFKKYEAEEICFTINDYQDELRFTLESMTVDTDSLKRQPDIASSVEVGKGSELEAQAAQDGLIYSEMDGEIGCIVNGAGLAMATNDTLAHFGSGAANFLDTGGQATTGLLVKAFALLISDSKVKAILVNIFGGVIRCDMIAESIIRAAEELDLHGIPIVVRLRGTNQGIGQKMIADANLALYAVDEIDAAVTKVISVAKSAPSRAPKFNEIPGSKRQFSTRGIVHEDDRLARLQKFDIDASTRLIYQGFTGTVATSNAQATLSYGTNVVGGVSPGKGGTRHLDLPVFNTVQEAKEALRPDATAIFVPAFKAKDAIMEAIEAEIPIIVSVSEGIPIHDTLQVHEALRASGRSRLIGPNCPGLINPAAKVRIGIMPYAQFSPGCIGIISKSGTLSYEGVSETTKHGLGQSIVLGIGGDMLPGTSMVEALSAILPRADTKGVILIGEIGGRMELEAALWIKEHNVQRKPIVGLIAGHTAPEDKVMGHAGALRRSGDLTALDKSRALEEAGVSIVRHTGLLGSRMKALLERLSYRHVTKVFVQTHIAR